VDRSFFAVDLGTRATAAADPNAEHMKQNQESHDILGEPARSLHLEPFHSGIRKSHEQVLLIY
jgi:hypothetical protein